MPLVRYQRGEEQLLRDVQSRLTPQHPLSHAEFVDHYYAGSPYCHLAVAVDDEQRPIGVLGLERMNFRIPGADVTLGFGSNYYSFSPGAGAILMLHWLVQCDFGLLFGGSPDVHRLVDAQGWRRWEHVEQFTLNGAYTRHFADPPWRKMAKWIFAAKPWATRIDRRARHFLHQMDRPIEVIPEPVFTADLLRHESPFDLRFAPPVEYLNWRYNTHLSFVRYELFRLAERGDTLGYVVLNLQPHRVVVAQADASDAVGLALGIIAALAQVCRGRRARGGVFLTSADERMSRVYRAFGMRARRRPRSLAIGGLRSKLPELGDPARWLVHFDWGDNALRPPFLTSPPATGR